MFVRVPRENNIIRLPERFVRLIDIRDDGNLVFEVRHFVRQSDIVKKNARLVRISVSTRTFQKIDVTQSPGQVKPTSEQLVKNVLRLVPDTRNAIRNFDNFVVARKMVDNTVALDNNLVSQLMKATDPKSVKGLYKSKLTMRSVRDLNSENDNKPILQVNTESVIDNTPLRQMIQLNIMQGFDPSHVSEMTDDTSLTPHESTSGVSMKDGNHASHLTTTRFFKKMTQSVTSTGADTLNTPEETNVLTVESVFSDEVEVKTIINVPGEKIRDSAGNILSTFFKFELLNAGNVSIQTIQQPVNILRFLEAYFIPKSAPIVHFGSFDTTNKATVRVKQVDSKGVGVKVYRKNFEYVVNNISEYEFVAEFSVLPNSGFLTIPVDASPSYTTIYRVVPTGQQSSVSPEFTNIVINPKKTIKRRKYVAMTTKIVATGLSIDVSEVPVDVVSFVILQRDTSIHGSFSTVSDIVTQVDSKNESSFYSIIDTSVKSGHVYEYVCRLIYKNGDTFDAGRATVEYVPLVENLVDTKIENLVVSQQIDNFDVSFDISTVIAETDLDSVKKLLDAQGLDGLFSDDLFNERDKLQDLVAHNIDRVDLTEGVRETFGILTDTTFSDSKLRAINSVSPLQTGRKYRYEVSALLRAPETLFDGLTKTVTDATTKKQYTYSPAKFLHPITLTLGNITTTQTLTAHYPKSQFAFGNIGNLTIQEVSFADDSIYITESSAEAFDRKTNVIRWSINGSPQIIDHFIVMKEFLGQRTIVGKAHAINDTSTFRFFHELSSSDLGDLVYIIVPVFNDYTVGVESKTNSVKAE